MADRGVWMTVSEAADAIDGDAADVFQAVASGKLEQAPRATGESIKVRFRQRDPYNDQVHRG